MKPFDVSSNTTDVRLRSAVEAAFRNIVKNNPRFAWNAQLLAAIQNAVLEAAASGKEGLQDLIDYAQTKAERVVIQPAREPSRYVARKTR